MSIRAKDIAEMMNVSTSTVSIVLNHKPGVSDQKRKEILDKIHELNCDYLIRPLPAHEPSDSGGQHVHVLRETEDSWTAATHTGVEQGDEVLTAPNQNFIPKNIGFIVYKRVRKIVEESPFFNYFIDGIERRLRELDCRLSYGTLSAEDARDEQLAYLESMNSAGFIVCGTEMYYEDLEAFKASGLPFVILDNLFEENDVDAVAINNNQGVRLAIRHLYENGHREIGYIRSRERINSFDERFRIARTILNKLKIPLKQENIIDVGYSEADIKREVRDFFLSRSENCATAFFAENDYIACHAMQSLMELGFKIPEDISVVGFDDRPICQMIQPNVTTINVPSDVLGPASVDLLIEKMEGGRTCSLKMQVGTRLIERESVGPPAR